MVARRLPWSLRSQSRRRKEHRQWALEWLEDRTLLSVSPLDAALPLDFLSRNVSQVSDSIASPAEVDLFRVTLNQGDALDNRHPCVGP
jgi:hypothetical protein